MRDTPRARVHLENQLNDAQSLGIILHVHDPVDGILAGQPPARLVPLDGVVPAHQAASITVIAFWNKITVRENHCGTREKKTVPEQFFESAHVSVPERFSVKENRSNRAFRNGLF